MSQTSRSSHANANLLADPNALLLGHPLPLVLRTQPRSGGP